VNKMELLAYCVLILYGILTIFPLYWLFLTSIKNQREILAYPPIFFTSLNLSNYIELFVGVKESFAKFLTNSIIVGIISNIIVTGFGLLAAYAFVRYEFRAKGSLLHWILTIRMAPPIFFLIPMYIMYRTLGLHDTLVGLILMYIGINLPLAIWMLRGFLASIAKDIIEAAQLDGCSDLKILMKILLPMIMPGVSVVFILCLLFTWNEFLYAYILTGVEAKTAVVAIYRYLSFQEIHYGCLAAAGIIVSIPLIMLAIFTRKYMIKAMTLGIVR